MKDRLIYKHEEHHYVSRTSWLRAAVLGANDGIISVSSLVIGIASASAASDQILIAGVAGLVSGAMSMAAGEYVSVSSQADLENADLARESDELKKIPALELQELADIYVERGVEQSLATEVAKQMMNKDALATHAREELGISELTTAKPLQAALASAASFSFGATFPVLAILFLPHDVFILTCSALCIILLGSLGTLAAYVGGAPVIKPAIRIMFWGAAAMGFTALIGNFVGVQVSQPFLTELKIVYDNAITMPNNIFEKKLMGSGTIVTMSGFIIGKINLKAQAQMPANMINELNITNNKLFLQNFSIISFPNVIPINTDRVK